MVIHSIHFEHFCESVFNAPFSALFHTNCTLLLRIHAMFITRIWWVTSTPYKTVRHITGEKWTLQTYAYCKYSYKTAMKNIYCIWFNCFHTDSSGHCPSCIFGIPSKRIIKIVPHSIHCIYQILLGCSIVPRPLICEFYEIGQGYTRAWIKSFPSGPIRVLGQKSMALVQSHLFQFYSWRFQFILVNKFSRNNIHFDGVT